MTVGNYSLNNVVCNFLGAPISGYGQGGAIKIEKEDPTYKHIKGTAGDVARYKVGNTVYKITFTLLQTAKSNAILTAIQQLDEASDNGVGIGTLFIADLGGSSILSAGSAWIEGPPPRDYTNEPKDNEWVLIAVVDTNIIGGN